MQGETVKIVSADFADGFVIIEKDDLDPESHELFVEPKVKQEPSKLVDEGKSDEDGDGDEAPTVAKLMKQFNKTELLAAAEEKGIKFDVPDEVTKETIAKAILGGE